MFNKIRKKTGRIFLNYYKQRLQKKYNSSLIYSLDTVRCMLKKSKYCFLITNSQRKWPSARLVQPIIELDTLVVWFGTNPSLRKIKEIEENPFVTIAFGKDSENANLIIYGKATIVNEVRERAKHWISSWLLFFPSGPRGKDFVSIRVDPLEIELMNFKKYIVPEPFGLNPIKLVLNNSQWEMQY
jgi:general stress protein 26